MLLNDIRNLSSEAQTSCLEGFHATLNHWHPKMICFPGWEHIVGKALCEFSSVLSSIRMVENNALFDAWEFSGIDHYYLVIYRFD